MSLHRLRGRVLETCFLLIERSVSDGNSSEGVRSRQKETKRDAPVGWFLLPSHEGTGAGVPIGEASATGSGIRESQEERNF